MKFFGDSDATLLTTGTPAPNAVSAIKWVLNYEVRILGAEPYNRSWKVLQMIPVHSQGWD